MKVTQTALQLFAIHLRLHFTANDSESVQGIAAVIRALPRLFVVVVSSLLLCAVCRGGNSSGDCFGQAPLVTYLINSSLAPSKHGLACATAETKGNSAAPLGLCDDGLEKSASDRAWNMRRR